MRLVVAAALTVVLLGATAAYCVVAILGYQARQQTPPDAQAAAFATQVAADRIVFRATSPDAAYGFVASVSAADPSGARSVSDVACERIYSGARSSMCLRIDRGVLTTFSANLLDEAGAVAKSWPLPGIPSRARVSPDGERVAFTSFVTGEAYATVGFSTATQIATVGGDEFGNLEEFGLTIDGEANTAADRNFWGVTFTNDPDIFYATAATNSRTWLVRGSLAARTLTTVHESVECPSVSPDGTRIAYKKNVSTTATAYWSIAVLDLATNEETVMPDPRNIDDQIEWLDDSTLLYGVPRDDQPGDSDVWSIPADGSGASALFIEHASSPSVVRP
ncbi:PD40 domain-containing protein [Conyzicola nivalis]|uniref:TolB-like translocation protein signal peptide n=1 Tax=Conyzicola nivalis TaxID=1477021 RepID=A0A916WL18_9MICO|nr:PD40 domain-containing protein [Conyzicola nivalis]GGB10204.1 TolB-like translocation protein; signal peptide [Conyzicola nivalis]